MRSIDFSGDGQISGIIHHRTMFYIILACKYEFIDIWYEVWTQVFTILVCWFQVKKKTSLQFKLKLLSVFIFLNICLCFSR